MADKDDVLNTPDALPPIDSDALATATTIEGILDAVKIPATEPHIRSAFLDIETRTKQADTDD